MYKTLGLNKISINKCIVAIPARLESSRLPNKLILDIEGKPMLQHVLERCKNSTKNMKVVLCTDNKILEELAINLEIPFLKTSKECDSGSQRISEVVDKLVGMAWDENLDKLDEQNKKELISQTGIINVQGDQPFLDSSILSKMESYLINTFPAPDVVTPIYPLKPENIHNSAVVKTIIGHSGRAIYFSRAAIPHIRDVNKSEWHLNNIYWGHIGMYGYRGDVLSNWNNLKTSKLEKIEKLEQLRIIESNYNVSTFVTNGDSLSVDTLEQLEEARKIAKSFYN